jgi:hypothetical protein
VPFLSLGKWKKLGVSNAGLVKLVKSDTINPLYPSYSMTRGVHIFTPWVMKQNRTHTHLFYGATSKHAIHHVLISHLQQRQNLPIALPIPTVAAKRRFVKLNFGVDSLPPSPLVALLQLLFFFS